MGKSLLKIIYSVKEAITNFNVTDDSRFSDEYLADLANAIRLDLIDEDFKAKRLDDSFYQKLCCIEVECVKEVCVVDGINVSTGHVTYYSNIPALKKKIGWDNIKYIGTETTTFGRLALTAFMYADKAPYGNKSPVYTVIGDKVYFKNLPTSGLKYVCIVAVLENPNDISMCEDALNEDFPVSDIYKLEYLMKRDILFSLGLPTDRLNNTRDDSVDQQIKK